MKLVMWKCHSGEKKMKKSPTYSENGNSVIEDGRTYSWRGGNAIFLNLIIKKLLIF